MRRLQSSSRGAGNESFLEPIERYTRNCDPSHSNSIKIMNTLSGKQCSRKQRKMIITQQPTYLLTVE